MSASTESEQERARVSRAADSMPKRSSVPKRGPMPKRGEKRRKVEVEPLEWGLPGGGPVKSSPQWGIPGGGVGAPD
eukprot:12886680-Prorocentrum_lima.AAC.1